MGGWSVVWHVLVAQWVAAHGSARARSVTPSQNPREPLGDLAGSSVPGLSQRQGCMRAETGRAEPSAPRQRDLSACMDEC